jgi:RNA polymerase sigma factor (sigma-70 family)
LVGWARGRLPASARGLLDTDDLVQETLVNTIRHLDRLDEREQGFLHYVRTALRNRILNAIRDAKRQPGQGDLDQNLVSPGFTPIDEIIGREAEHRFNEALDRLDPVLREMVIARIELRMTWADIAIHFGKPSPSAARNPTNRAIERLAREMDGNGNR